MTDKSEKQESRFVLLLGGFFLMLFASAFVQLFEGEHRVASIVMSVGFVSMLVSAALSVGGSRFTVILLRSLAGLMVLLSVVNSVTDLEAAQVSSEIIGLVFLTLIVVPALGMLLKADRVTMDTVAASICVYLLLGMIWAMLYSLVERVQPGSFRMPEGEEMSFGAENSINVLYYSYVTLTTLGFGDVTPVKDTARLLTIIEAMIGQIFLVVLVARLVSINVAQAMGRGRDG
ncbi:MAG: potassium channel family protein [Planctomycetota bacterium]|nr:potassium channel family protein [Planctomycetota bacterium]